MNRILFMLCLLIFQVEGFAKDVDYVVVTSEDVRGDKEWAVVVDTLAKKHQAKVLYYKDTFREIQDELQALNPRYVAFVEKPERLNRDYVIDIHRMSREMDDDIFEDFLWGIITGYDAHAAMKMLRNSTEPLIVKDAVSTITELKSAKWFDRYGWIDDHELGLWGEKESKDDSVSTGYVERPEILKKLLDLYAKYDPDLVVTAYHATENNLSIPFSAGNIFAKDGCLVAHAAFSNDVWPLKETGKRRVYFAVGNCLIGNVNNTRNSMAIAWMNSANAATMIGYVVPTWHGRAGWGALKYWLTHSGRYTLAEAVFLNQQDFLAQQYKWYPDLYEKDFPSYDMAGRREAVKILEPTFGEDINKDHIGFWHDRDVLAYYGDPKWDVRLQEIPGERDFSVTWKKKRNKCIITIQTYDNFSIDRMKGEKFKEEHVGDLPFSYFFPQRLKNPRLAEGQNWNVALDENFLLIYNPDFEANKTYKVVLDID